MPTATRLCPACGHEFPPPALNHAQKSYDGAMLSTQVVAEWMDVDDVTYERWKGKEGKPDTLKVTYHNGMMTRVNEWLCPDHGGYAASKYLSRLPVLGGKAKTLADALGECETWVKPSRIKTQPDGKFQKIVQLDYKPKEIDHAAQASKETLNRNLEEMFDDIPF
jgi:DNA repair protein RadD